jgi:hypothetical protein
MADQDSDIPLLAGCVWRLHQCHAARGEFPLRCGTRDADALQVVLGQHRTRMGWAVTPETTQALERWLWRHCPDRLVGLLGEAWPTCTDPERMLAWLGSIPASRRGRPTPRKLRLFACAAVRLVWDRLTDERCRRAVEAAERFADGAAVADELVTAREAAFQADLGVPDTISDLHRAAHQAAAWDAAFAAETAAAGMRRFEETAPQSLCGLVRDVFIPPPFRAVAVAPSWLSWNGGIVARMARAAYDGRAFGDLPVLADALEEAGCTEAAMLAALRTGGPHARGSWPLDLLLGKG